jgi:steroid delta-isomerase-like uncharacterized protein
MDRGTVEGNEAAGPLQRDLSTLREGFQRIWNEGDLTMMDDTFAPDAVFYNGALPEPMRGLDEVKSMFLRLRGAFPDIEMTVEDLFGAGDWAAVRYTMRGTHLGDYFGVPPTGNSIVSTENEFFRIVDGRIRELWLELDISNVLRQLGVFPAFDSLPAPVAHMLARRQRRRTARATDAVSAPAPTCVNGCSSHTNALLMSRALAGIWNERNLEVIDDLFAPNVAVHHPIDRDIRGVDGFRSLVALLLDGLPDLRVTIQRVFATEDRVAARWIIRGTHTGRFFGIPATNSAVTIPINEIGRIEDGRLAELWLELNLLGVAQQLGVVPPLERVPPALLRFAAFTQRARRPLRARRNR